VANELGNEMLRIGGAATVTKRKDLPAGGQRSAYRRCGRRNARQAVIGKSLVRRQSFIENIPDDVDRARWR
jgi:hypothetical protein